MMVSSQMKSDLYSVGAVADGDDDYDDVHDEAVVDDDDFDEPAAVEAAVDVDVDVVAVAVVAFGPRPVVY